jgi:hypothetical protein
VSAVQTRRPPQAALDPGGRGRSVPPISYSPQAARVPLFPAAPSPPSAAHTPHLLARRHRSRTARTDGRSAPASGGTQVSQLLSLKVTTLPAIRACARAVGLVRCRASGGHRLTLGASASQRGISVLAGSAATSWAAGRRQPGEPTLHHGGRSPGRAVAGPGPGPAVSTGYSRPGHLTGLSRTRQARAEGSPDRSLPGVWHGAVMDVLSGSERRGRGRFGEANERGLANRGGL